MGDVRIFISHAVKGETQSDAQTLKQFIQALRSAGANVLTDTHNSTDESFTQFLNEELPTCQWFILFQTPEAISSSRVHLAVDAAMKLVERHSLQKIFRIISGTSEKAIIPPAWERINTFDATYDAQRAIEKLLLALPLHKTLSSTTPIVAPPPTKHTSTSPSTGYDRPAVPPSKLKIHTQALQGAQSSSPFFQRRKLLSILTMLVILAVLGVGLGGFFFLRAQTSITTNQSYGHVYFFNSDRNFFNPDPKGANNVSGTCDEIQITLNNLKPPAAGNSYYAWLLPDQNVSHESTIFTGTFLTTLLLNNGSVNLTYVNPSHKNLLLNNSRFLITEESSGTRPNNPSPDQNTWRYYAAIPQTSNPNDVNHYSELDYIRQLLAADPTINRYYFLHAGLNDWFYKNIRKIEEWSSSAQVEGSSVDDTYAHNDMIYILDALDGKQNFSADVPSGIHSFFNSPIPLLTLNPGNQNPLGYIDNMEQHMQGLSTSPDATAGQQALARQIITALHQVNNSLNQAHKDAKKLVTMSGAQLEAKATFSLLEDLMVQANNAFVGQINPTTGQRSGGATWIHDVIPQLATLNVTQYTVSH